MLQGLPDLVRVAKVRKKESLVCVACCVKNKSLMVWTSSMILKLLWTWNQTQNLLSIYTISCNVYFCVTDLGGHFWVVSSDAFLRTFRVVRLRLTCGDVLGEELEGRVAMTSPLLLCDVMRWCCWILCQNGLFIYHTSWRVCVFVCVCVYVPLREKERAWEKGHCLLQSKIPLQFLSVCV